MENDKMYFILNNRFGVDVSLNLLTNNETGLQTRLEPRLIEILQLLANNEGKLVSRELLISKIWNNYGGAEDGLNQGISILRKALADTNKQIIETIPKKGYILHATVTEGIEEVKLIPKKEKTFTKGLLFSAIFLGIFILIALLLFNPGGSKIPYKSEKQVNSLSQSDFIVSKNWKGNNYTLQIEKNKKILLFENNIQIADSNLMKYAIVIQELKDKLASEQDANR